MTRSETVLVLAVAMATGCPTQVDAPAAKTRQERPRPTADESDPRVVRKGDDLYPAQTIEAAEQRTQEAIAGQDGLGSGRPDETNGTCRLYAPNLPRPECCAAEFGFDVDSLKQACGVDIYLGESFQDSCGYYFHQEDQPPTRSYVRMKFVEAQSPKAAADNHDASLRGRLPDFRSEPIPGIEGGWWSSWGGVSWAFLPGWPRVRQLTWRESLCTREQMLGEIAKIVAAKPPPKGAPRAGLLPRRRS